MKMAIPSRLRSTSIKETLDPSWLRFTFSDLWERNAESFADKEAIVDSKTRLTWFLANRWIDQISDSFLQLGFKKNDCVAIQLPNCVELPLLRIACERAGLICLPLSRVLRGKEVEYILNKVRTKAFVTTWRFRDFDYFKMIEEIKERVSVDHIIIVGEEVPAGTVALNSLLRSKKGDVAYKKTLQSLKCRPEEFSLVTHTTGVTGFPKFVENPIFSRMELAKAQVERIRMTSSDVTGTFSPNAGGPNTIGYFASPIVGAKVVMLEHFEPEEAMKRIEKERITVLPVVPAMVLMMIDHPRFKDYDLSSLRVIVSGGAPFNYREALRAEKEIGCPIVQFYGSVDSGIGVMGHPKDSVEVRLNTVGRPLGRCEIRVQKEDGRIVAPAEQGDIFMRSPDCFSGYFLDPEANKVAWDGEGWFRLEDLGTLDKEGNLIIFGRIKEMINRGGQKIIPGEIEGIISQYEKVAQVGIIGIPDKIMGERSCAYIVLKKGTKTTLEEINTLLKENKVAHYKWLDRLEIVDELPTIGGKVDKKKLMEDIRQKLEREKIESHPQALGAKE
jgi:non-ribosomal peptide synthetase component E (peptide arylation enzyme)